MPKSAHRPENVRAYLEIVESAAAEWFDDDDAFGPWFRGQKKASWPLCRKLYRDYGGFEAVNRDEIEGEIREDFIVRAPIFSDVKPAGSLTFSVLRQEVPELQKLPLVVFKTSFLGLQSYDDLAQFQKQYARLGTRLRRPQAAEGAFGHTAFLADKCKDGRHPAEIAKAEKRATVICGKERFRYFVISLFHLSARQSALRDDQISFRWLPFLHLPCERPSGLRWPCEGRLSCPVSSCAHPERR